MLQWGEVSIVQRLCQVPAPYFSTPARVAVAAPTLVAVCYRADRACDLAERFLDSLQLLLDFVTAHQQLRKLGSQQEGSAPAGEPSAAAAAAAAALKARGAKRQAQPPGRAAAGAPVGVRLRFEERFPFDSLDDAAVYLEARLQRQQRRLEGCSSSTASSVASEPQEVSKRAAVRASKPGAAAGKQNAAKPG